LAARARARPAALRAPLPRRRGGNPSGQLGTVGYSPGSSSAPLAVQASGGGALAGVASVSAGTEFACARAADGTQAWCWGADNYGQLGNGDASSSAAGAVVVTNPGVGAPVAWAQVEAFDGHACGRSAAGAYCWGFLEYVGVSPVPGANVAAPVAVSAAPTPQTWARLGTGCASQTTVAVADGGAAIYGWGARCPPPRARARPRPHPAPPAPAPRRAHAAPPARRGDQVVPARQRRRRRRVLSKRPRARRRAALHRRRLRRARDVRRPDRRLRVTWAARRARAAAPHAAAAGRAGRAERAPQPTARALERFPGRRRA
jgi:hypothetical protein